MSRGSTSTTPVPVNNEDGMNEHSATLADVGHVALEDGFAFIVDVESPQIRMRGLEEQHARRQRADAGRHSENCIVCPKSAT